MTDTGQVPGQGLPENAGMVEQPPGIPAPGEYTYLNPSEPTTEDEDLLLMPSAQGGWNDPQVVPAEAPVAYATPDGYAVPEGYAPPETYGAGYAVPAGYAVQDGYAVPEGYVAPEGYAVPEGYVDPEQQAPVQQQVPPIEQPAPMAEPVSQVPAQTPDAVQAQQEAPAEAFAEQAVHPEFQAPAPTGQAEVAEPAAEVPEASVPGAEVPVQQVAPEDPEGAAVQPPQETAEETQTPHQPGAHETGGRDTGSVDLSGVRIPQPVSAPAPAPAPAQAAAPAPVRRPLHMGPPVPDPTGGVVRSLADRGPAGAPTQAVRVRPQVQAQARAQVQEQPQAQPQEQVQVQEQIQEQAPVQEQAQVQEQPPATGPEYLDVPREEPAVLPGPQLGEMPPQAGEPWTTEPPQSEGAPEVPEAAVEAPAMPEAPEAVEAPEVPAETVVPEPEPEPEQEPEQAAESVAEAQEAEEVPEVQEPVETPEVLEVQEVHEVQEAAEPAPVPDVPAAPVEPEPVEAAVAEPQPDTEPEPVAPEPAADDEVILAPTVEQPAAVEEPIAEAPIAEAPEEAEPVAEPVAVQESAPEPEPEPESVPQPEPELVQEAPQAAPPEPEAAPESEAVTVPEAVLESEPVPEPVLEAEPATAPEAAPEPGVAAEPEAAAPEDASAPDDRPEAGLATEPAPESVPQEGTAQEGTAQEGTAAESGYDDAEREAVLRVMRERRDIRNGFRSDPIPHEVLLRVLEAAHTAPSVGHSQPWDFVVIRSAETRRSMHELAQRQRDAYAKSLPKGRAKQFKELKIEAILDTPVNIVVTADPTRGGRHTLGRHTQPQMAPYSSALAVENLWLAARAEGLGVGWVSFFDEHEMVRALGLPEHLDVVAYLCVGYVDEFPQDPELMQAGWSKRRPLSWVVHEETYGRRALPGEEPHDLLQETIAGIRPLDAKALGEAWERQKRMTKPAGALGMLEIISAQLSGLSRLCPPPIPEPAAVAIFAGDHGVHAQGVTPWPQEVTAQMVANFLGGGAVCNAFANQVGAEVCVVDVGVASELPATPGLLPRKVRAGTGDFTTGPALSREDVLSAIEVGIETARDLVAAGNKALLTGEMGIANTTVSAALICVYTGQDPAEVTGRGTGINDEMHARKVDVVRRALDFHQPDPADPIGVLAAVGGLEHAALVGFLLGGASMRTPVVLDGVSAGAAALVARAIAPEALAACIAGHRSAEPGHVAALNKLGLRPLVDLDLRLGEGTGALLALPVIQSAARAMHEVATFDAAGVTEK
ncbi:nicotinate-nucleotide--dimethylbenzimidazole phosphoribosyltransferase [Streptomyces sp. NPDC088400]|uniref:nicotinate-nucleotide--dimethylbenzimidazole phosphoribosyltransferase n=1 Tax=Streptomyces sp. NPDC088400 TaxID=3365861 RepID=UPI003808C73B